LKHLVDKLIECRHLLPDEYKQLLVTTDPYLRQKANEVRKQVFGNKIFARGLIEFTNYCKNDCYYCGLRFSNKNCNRYRLSVDEILESCAEGYALGYRTFVLQGGEDPHYNSDEPLLQLVKSIRVQFPDCAITLSIGERSYDSYKALYNAGADRFLLRHETANDEHYAKLHPKAMTLANRKQCLYDLKEIGFQVGCGMMIGSPHQTLDHIVEDLNFIKELDPEMVGCGPFLPHSDTPFGKESAGNKEITLNVLAILRLMKPNLNLPATTALGTLEDDGREQGIMCGANVVMPNISPTEGRKKYQLYDGKIGTTDNATDSGIKMAERMKKIGCEIAVNRGDYING